MSRQQGHVANVLWVLFDHVIESQRQARMSKDTDMQTGKQSPLVTPDWPILSPFQTRFDRFRIEVGLQAKELKMACFLQLHCMVLMLPHFWKLYNVFTDNWIIS
jgi:hypothetical protein